jgi:hypothetical protein
MNKTDIVEIMSKKTTKFSLLSVVVVGMMVVLVPMIIEEVDARTNAKATSLIGPFSDVKVQLSRGSFWTSPSQPSPNVVTWVTWGGCPFGHCSEIGRFTANVGSGLPKVDVTFANPGSGPNRCSVADQFAYRTTCHITQGVFASLTITVTPRVQENNNGHCDILNKFDGIDQSKVIREKLHC